MVEVIAEIGVCHGGRPHHMLERAVEAGATCVKYQLFDSQRLWGDDRIKHLELDADRMQKLKDHADVMGVDFLCTPFDEVSLDELVKIGVERIKIASGMLRRIRFLEAVAETRLPVILSTGMSSIPEINNALAALGHGWPAHYHADITLLHCVSAYPCPLDQVNLHALAVLKHQWGARCAIGYSDHTDGIAAPVAAVALGAQVIEKHLTFDRNAEGPDHLSSIEPREFRLMVDMIRDVEDCLKYHKKEVMPAEVALREVWK